MVLMRLNRDRILGKGKLIGPIKALGANRLDKSDGHAAAEHAPFVQQNKQFKSTEVNLLAAGR